MTTTSAKQSVASRLHAGESFIVSFGGQATPWRETLDSLVATDSRLDSRRSPPDWCRRCPQRTPR